MAEPYCESCDLPRAQCFHGLSADKQREHDGVRRVLDLVASGPTITASQHGPCAARCGNQIEPDQQITYTPEGWAHADEVEQRPNVFEGIV